MCVRFNYLKKNIYVFLVETKKKTVTKKVEKHKKVVYFMVETKKTTRRWKSM